MSRPAVGDHVREDLVLGAQRRGEGHAARVAAGGVGEDLLGGGVAELREQFLHGLRLRHRFSSGRCVAGMTMVTQPPARMHGAQSTVVKPWSCSGL